MSTEERNHPLKRIALVGNPNVGKTSLFNKLCGLNQKTGNYPGVTIDKKRGQLLHNETTVEVIDLPGITSLYPNSKDEELVVNYLLEKKADDFPQLVVVVTSALNLKRNLYLCDQLLDLDIPVVLAINMIDLAEKRGIIINEKLLSEELGIPVVKISARSERGLNELKHLLLQNHHQLMREPHYIEPENRDLLHQFSKVVHLKNEYESFLVLTHEPSFVSSQTLLLRKDFIAANSPEIRKWKINESILRYKFLSGIISKSVVTDRVQASDPTTKADRVLLHPIWGYAIFLFILFAIFQSVFWLAAYPMDWIDSGISWLSSLTSESLPEGYFTRLLTEGIIPGIGGVVIFVPQIAILFFLFSLLDEIGYMPRIVYLMDKLMQRFGMSGKSIVPLISGMACAVPAIMAARTIENKKERLITILVTPLLTCSARIPVYTVLVALVIPDITVGIFNLRGLVLMGMYILGIFTALIAAWVFKKILKNDFKSYLLLEMPEYLMPAMRNVLINVWENVRSFLWNAGKIIVATSIILFVLATNGLHDFKTADEYVEKNHPALDPDLRDQYVAARQLETSYLGIIGKTIEPTISPLGYDWKIGIAIIASLSAREVFVGTVSTIYSIGSEEELKVADRLRNEKNLLTGKPIYGLATCVSLLLFYAFALQCFSTVATTYKETLSVKWTLIQFAYMTLLAYFAAFIGYQLLA